MLTPVTVQHVEHVSPSFVRVTLAHPDLADFGVDGPLLDQRIKLIFPGPAGFPALSEDDWWTELAELPDDRRCPVRTYTVADVAGSGPETAIQVDFVLHPGAHGPGSDWAQAAGVGDELMIVVPHRGRDFGGIEFDPGAATDLLIVGDETALPAIAQILRGLPPDARGSVFVEVPLADDLRADLDAPAGVEVTWVFRSGRPVGVPLADAVRTHLALPSVPAMAIDEPEIDPDLWETPTFSSSGDRIAPALDELAATTAGHATYAWIAGESGMVTTLRRHLVTDLGTPRHQVAFMGYWREGVAMRG